MATQTPLHHPRESEATPQFFPFTATFKTTAATGAAQVVFSSPCAYQAAQGGQSDEFEAEAPASDRLLLPRWRVEAQNGQTVVVEMRGTVKRFTVLDALPDGDKTLVIVTPKN